MFLSKMQAKYPTARFLAVNCETDQPREEDLARMRQAVEEWEPTFVTGVDDGLKVWDLSKINAPPLRISVRTAGH